MPSTRATCIPSSPAYGPGRDRRSFVRSCRSCPRVPGVALRSGRRERAVLVARGRRPLTPSERAAGYLRLTTLGCTVRSLAAKVGRSASHVRTHLALLELPERAQAAVDAGELTLADVAALAKVKDEPELIEQVLATPAWTRHDIAGVIDRRKAQRRQEEAFAEAVAAEEAKGHRVVPAVTGGQSRARRLLDLGFSVADHEGEPCNAVTVERTWNGVEVVTVCDDPRRHTAKAAASTTRSTLQVAPAAVVAQSPEDRERRADASEWQSAGPSSWPRHWPATAFRSRGTRRPTACGRSWTTPGPTPGRRQGRCSGSSRRRRAEAARTGTVRCGRRPSVPRPTCSGSPLHWPPGVQRRASAATAVMATGACATSRP